MNTFIISSKNFEKALEKAEEINKENKVNKFDIDLSEFEKALGIEDVRNIQKNIFLKPFRGNKKTTIILMRNGATIEAQSSMLKLLEEPPPSSLIILVTQNYHAFLPTILSRVTLIEIKEDIATESDGLEKILDMEGAGDSLYLAQVLSKDKTEAINWLEKAILAAREKMLENLEDKHEALNLRKLIHKLELTHYDLKTTNVNPRLSLENLLLNI